MGLEFVVGPEAASALGARAEAAFAFGVAPEGVISPVTSVKPVETMAVEAGQDALLPQKRQEALAAVEPQAPYRAASFSAVEPLAA